MSTNPPEDEVSEEQEAPAEDLPEEDDAQEPEAAPAPAAVLAEEVATAIGARDWSGDFDTAKVKVAPEGWAAAVAAVRDRGYPFFSFLSAIDWSADVAVGEPLAEPDGVEERYEVLCALGNTRNNDVVVLSTDLPKDNPALDSLVEVVPGAGWHEREAAEMFGIDFLGNPNLVKLYLPDAFEGYPLRKSFPLLSREVKPWPGTVDVEDMPTTDNPEAGGDEAAEAGEDE